MNGVLVDREALEWVLDRTEVHNHNAVTDECACCGVTLVDYRTTGNLYQDHEPDCPTRVLRAALALPAQAAADAAGVQVVVNLLRTTADMQEAWVDAPERFTSHVRIDRETTCAAALGKLGEIETARLRALADALEVQG